jgi:hypothetical protein
VLWYTATNTSSDEFLTDQFDALEYLKYKLPYTSVFTPLSLLLLKQAAVTVPDAVILVAPVIAPDTFADPSKDCPQRVLAVANFVAVVAVAALPVILADEVI